MREKLRKNWRLILMAIITIVLGVIAIIAALKLYQLGKKPIGPTVSKPMPAVTSLTPTPEPSTPGPECTLNFNVP